MSNKAGDVFTLSLHCKIATDSHIFPKYQCVCINIKIKNFKETLNNDIVNFKQLALDCSSMFSLNIILTMPYGYSRRIKQVGVLVFLLYVKVVLEDQL